MKKTILIGVLFLSAALASFAADGNKPSRKITSSFNKSFSGAKDVSWQKNQEFVVATFNMKGQVMTAYYTRDAVLAAVVHNMLSDQLPVCLLTSLKMTMNDHWVTNLYEESKDGSSHYYVTVENADELIVLKSLNNAHWVIDSRTEKLLI
jgi:hypothetical protein